MHTPAQAHCSKLCKLARQVAVVIFLCLLAACTLGATSDTSGGSTPGANTPVSASTPTLPTVTTPDACALVTAESEQGLLDQEIQIAKDAVATLG